MEQTTPPVGDRPLPPAGPPAPQDRPGNDGFFDSVRRVGIVRTQDRWIGGVAGGLARRFDIDPLLVRGILGVTVLLGGAGLVIYGLAWALLPEEVDGRIHLQETFAGRFDAAVLGALAFVIIGANRGVGWNGWWDDNGFGWVGGLLWFGVLVAVVAMVISATSGRGRPGTTSGDPTAAGWAPPPPPPGGRSVPHPGYGTVPLASPAPSAPAWTGSAPRTTAPVPPPPGAAAGYGGGPSGATALRPQQPVVPPTPPQPPRPPRPRVLGPGAGMVGTVVGLSLLALAALLVVEREGELGQPVALTALGIGIVLAGLGILISGLRGRRSGVLGFLAIAGIVLAVPAAIIPDSDAEWGFLIGDGERAGISSGEVWRPDTVEEARRGLSVGVGDVNVDLTDVPLDEGVVEVPISMGAGDLEVVVPDDVAVTGEIDLTAGQIRWDVDGTSQVAGFSGDRAPELYQSDEAADGDVELAVRITAGAGDVRVVEENR